MAVVVHNDISNKGNNRRSNISNRNNNNYENSISNSYTIDNSNSNSNKLAYYLLPFSLQFRRWQLGAHLSSCPASVVVCMAEWNRWPANQVMGSAKREDGPRTRNPYGGEGQLGKGCCSIGQRYFRCVYLLLSLRGCSSYCWSIPKLKSSTSCLQTSTWPFGTSGHWPPPAHCPGAPG